MRSWTGDTASLDLVVMMEQVVSVLPSPFQVSYSPAMAKYS
ncbi:MAG: hypothetical protein A4E29_00773 [Methanomassiliicoccales archaeon PtaB.Bin134]|nr:MAG: hypothetical protein A4E29_00773 [Methanomassiliicoccales archaeon PtaB.Bin134]